MKELGGFRTEELLIEIEGPEGIDMTFTDLMGLRAVGDADNAQIVPILKTYIESPNVVPIMLVQLHHDPELIKNDLRMVLKTLNVTRDDLRGRAMVWCTRFDEKGTIQSVDDLVNILDTVHGLGLDWPCVFGCNPGNYVYPPQSIPKDGAQLSVFFRRVEENEARAVDAYLGDLERKSDVALSAEHRSSFTLRKAVAKLRQKWVESFSQNIGAIQHKLAERINNCMGAVRGIQGLLDNKSLRAQATLYLAADAVGSLAARGSPRRSAHSPKLPPVPLQPPCVCHDPAGDTMTPLVTS
jgi:hypothetical protein